MVKLKNILISASVVLFLTNCATTSPGTTGQGKELKDYSVYANMFDALRSVSGVTVNRSGRGGGGNSVNSGGSVVRNNSGVEVSIRGSQSATNTNEPLFVLNGIPLGRGFDNITDINPVDIEKITVQRGLAAANRWGSEGNSGAILITTKGNK